jgi:hypothetical protein
MNDVVALGLASEVGVFIVGTVDHSEQVTVFGSLPTIRLTHCVRMYEISDPNDPRRVGFTYHPDPMMTSEVPMTFSMDKVLCYRHMAESEEMAIKYRAFLTQFRLSRSGLVSGVSSIDQQRKILAEGV